jgi:hypothetical protein
MPRPSHLRLLSLVTALVCAIATPSARASSPVVVEVPPQGAYATGVILGAGQQATITGDGSPECQSEGNLPCYGYGPDGADAVCSDFDIGNCPAPTLPVWSLVGKVKSGGAWKLVGSGPTTLVGPGEIYLAYNDDGFDNYGQFTAIIEVSDVGSASITGITGAPTSVAPRSASIPLSGLPVSNPLGRKTDELASTPLRSSPLRSSPLRSSPLRSSPLRSSPLRSSALGALSLAELPLRSSSWDVLLAGTSLDVPPASLTLDQVLSLDPLPASIAELTLADLDLANTPLRSSSLAEVLLSGAPIRRLAAPGNRTWCQVLRLVSDCELGERTISDVVRTSVLEPGDLADIPLAAPTDLSGTVLSTILLADLNLAATPLAGRTDLGGFSTVGELAAALPLPGLTNLTLGDLLPGLVAPADLPLELAPLSTILTSAPRQSTGLLRYRIALQTRCEAASVTVSATLPPTARYAPGSAKITVGSTTTNLPDPPSPSALTLGFDLSSALATGCTPGTEQTSTLSFDVEPPARLGVPRLDATVIADGAVFAATGPSDSSVDDVDDPGNTPATAAPITAGSLQTGYIATSDDADAYRLAAPPVGSTVTVTLSHLPADYDVTITGPPVGVPSAPLRSSPLRSSPLRSSTIGDASDARTGTANPAALQDLPLRSSELASTPLRSSSIDRGLTTESATFTVTPDDAGKAFTVHVSGFNGAHSNDPYVLRVTVDGAKPAPACRAARTLPTATKGTFPSLPLATSTKTLFLVNEQRLAQLYPTADIAALRAKLAALAARPEVGGVVVPVESDPANPTAAAYAAWDAAPCSVTAANGVATAIRAVIGNVTQNLDGLKNIVVVGGDAVIPQVRVPDLTSTANEAEEADGIVFGGKDSAASRSLRDGFLLTDDGYGDFDPELGLAGAVFVPDVALGRLIETPGQIGDVIDLYTGAGGSLATQSAHVSGYDFLTDGAQEILARLSTLPGTDATSAINEQWTAADAQSALNRGTAGFSSVNAHYDHYRALPAAAFNGLAPDLLKAADIVPAAGSMLFTAGCHAGLNLVDADLPDATTADAARLRDWAQQVTTRAVYVANTTYGYGDTDTVAYSERLLGLLADGIASQEVTAGQALMIAKQRYAAEQVNPGVYDQKSSMGLTYYGLPFFTIGASGGEAPAVLPSTPPAGTQVRSSAFSVDPNFVRHDVSGGRTWWSVDDEAPQATHDRPIQPRTVKDVTATDGLPVHGAVVESLSDRFEFGIDAAYSDPTIDLAANEPQTPVSERSGTIFPDWVLRTTRGATTEGLRDQLVVVPGQYNQDQYGQRLYTHLAGQVLRSDSTDYDPPVITGTSAVQTQDVPDDWGAPSTVSFEVRTPSSDAVRAFVLYQPDYYGGDWVKLELTRVPGTDRWTGDARLGGFVFYPAYVVQVVDASGNVAVSTNKGDRYSPTDARDTGALPEFTTSPVLPASGYASGPVTVTLDAGRSKGSAFEVSVDGAAPQPYTGAFQVTGDGIHTVRFTGSDGSSGSTTVRIDTRAPVVDGAVSPAPSAEGFVRGPATVTWTCTDAVSGVASCPAPTALSTEGAAITTTSTEATDRAENTGTATAGPLAVDLNAPSGAVGTIASGATTVTGTAADSLAGVRTVEVTFTPTTSGPTAATTAATVTCAGADRRSCTWTVGAPTAPGTWSVSAVITDRAGRTTTVTGAGTITTGPTPTPTPTPICKTKVTVSVTVDVKTVVKGKTVITKKVVTATVEVVVPCCPKTTNKLAAALCLCNQQIVAVTEGRKKLLALIAKYGTDPKKFP